MNAETEAAEESWQHKSSTGYELSRPRCLNLPEFRTFSHQEEKDTSDVMEVMAGPLSFRR